MASKKILLTSKSGAKQALYTNGMLTKTFTDEDLANATSYTICEKDEDILRIAGGFPSKLSLMLGNYKYKTPKK